ncbi:MAG TPA: sugar phosphate isomerase/epimerase [Bryobacterales bacterium]|nr:sugar phosphate isomerase/epimerase [Bryobacterales bacterium]
MHTNVGDQKMRRREALKLAVLGAGGAMSAAGQNWAMKPPAPAFHGLKIGLTSYTTRKLTYERTLEELKGIRIEYISLKDVHLPLSSTREERLAAKKKAEDAGVKIMGVGVIYLKNDEAQIRHALQYAKDLGVPVATISPERAALPAVEKAVKEMDIQVAIHNHGPRDKVWPSPLGVFDAVRGLDSRIGCCVDVGHTFLLGVDPVDALRKCAPRLYGVHLKDLAAPQGPQDVEPHNVPVGTGVLDVVAMLRVLREIHFTQLAALEYEAEAEHPVRGMAESFGYLRGVLAAI